MRAWQLPGKALMVGMILWREAGWLRRKTVYFSAVRAARDGIPRTTAQRAIQQLQSAGLITIRRQPGRGLEVTLIEDKS
jgi:hypothetical protein